MSSSINQRLKQFRHSLDARSQTEKLIILAIALAAMVLLYLTVAFDPLKEDITRLRNQISATEAQISAQQSAYTAMMALSKDDPNRFATDRLATVNKQQALLIDEIARLAGDLVTPGEMTHMLISLLEQQAGLALVSFSNKPAKPLRIGVSAALKKLALEKSPMSKNKHHQNLAGQVYEHGLSLEFEGDFFSTLRYLQFIETVSGGFFWDSVKFSESDWPKARVTLEIHTLSTDVGFIGA